MRSHFDCMVLSLFKILFGGNTCDSSTEYIHQHNIYIYIKYIIYEFMNLGLNPFIFPFLNG